MSSPQQVSRGGAGRAISHTVFSAASLGFLALSPDSEPGVSRESVVELEGSLNVDEKKTYTFLFV